MVQFCFCFLGSLPLSPTSWDVSFESHEGLWAREYVRALWESLYLSLKQFCFPTKEVLFCSLMRVRGLENTWARAYVRALCERVLVCSGLCESISLFLESNSVSLQKQFYSAVSWGFVGSRIRGLVITSVSVWVSARLKVMFLLKTDSGYPRDAGFFFHLRWQTLFAMGSRPFSLHTILT